MTIQCDHNGRVLAAVSIDLPLPAISVWGQMRDLPGFATLDLFHDQIEIVAGDEPCNHAAAGIALRIHHRFGPCRLIRIGRILKWREGCGYSFSDLSARGRSIGFPHIYTYTIRPRSAGTSRLSLMVTGRWTAHWIPTALRKAWLWLVMAQTAAILRVHFYRFHRFRRRRAGMDGSGAFGRA
jgi:hypothetical protein